jgi:hypothetical protein
MNNTKKSRRTTLTAVFAIFIAATLVAGIGTFTTTTTQSAYAYNNNKKDNGKGNDNGNTVTIEECKNKGSASGFDTALDQECENLICTHPGENATCVQEGAVATTTATTPPVKLTCEQCFMKFLSSTQLSLLIQFLGLVEINSLPDLCAQLSSPGGPSPELIEALQIGLARIGVGTGHPIDVEGLIQCLLDAGIVFPTRTS